MAKKRPKPAAVDLAHIIPDLQPLAVPIEDLSLDPANARSHDQYGLAAIGASLSSFRQRKPLVADASGRILAGNGIFLAAGNLGWKHIAVVRVDDDESTARGYAVADNQTSDLSDWDLDVLFDTLDQIEADDPDLFTALYLDELRPEDDPQPEAVAVDVPRQFQVVIECPDEATQKTLFEQLQADGKTVKLLTI